MARDQAQTLAVSMFNVGFGDCFLVAVPIGGKTCRILFDCGMHRGGKPENQALADRVIAAATENGKARIDLVVATHRHKDHVSGFAAQGWEKVEVGEVWMPWTEDPTDPNARGLVARQLTSASTAESALMLANPLPADGSAEAAALGMVALALSNEAAMDTLYDGFSPYAGTAAKPPRRYLPDPADPEAPLKLDGFPGLRLHIMGPPRDPSTLGTMDPPKAETFRQLAAAAAAAESSAPLRPFAARWIMPGGPLSPDQIAAIQQFSSAQELVGLAAKIDNAINNTSLVIMVEIGTARLLFCADAQWGNWQTILANPHWCDLIAQTTFLKVGHHASHNATPVTLIDKLLPKGIPAAVSVRDDAYPSVPFPGLLDAMVTDKSLAVTRSDKWADVPQAPGVSSATEDVITFAVPF